MSKFFYLLKESLKKKIPDNELDLLPRSYQILGNVLLIKLNEKIYRHRRKIGKEIMGLIPYVKSVILIKRIKGVERTPETEVISGSKNTETIHKEHGCLFCLDAAKLMFSKGNKFERIRMAHKIRKTDVVVDMFAGVGYWTIICAKRAKKVYSIEINPLALRYLNENIKINRLNNVVVIKGDCRKHSSKLRNKADKIIMGYFNSKEFFPHALKIAKKGCVIFYHDIVKKGDESKLKEELKVLSGEKRLRFFSTRRVKSYAPGINHIVFDIKVL